MLSIFLNGRLGLAILNYAIHGHAAKILAGFNFPGFNLANFDLDDLVLDRQIKSTAMIW